MQSNAIPFPRKEKELRPMTNLKLVSNTGNTTGNWLLDLPEGSRFVVASVKQDNFLCLELELVSKTNKSAVLFEVSSNQPFGGGTGRVLASRFISSFMKVEDLQSYEDMLEEHIQDQEDPEKYVR